MSKVNIESFITNAKVIMNTNYPPTTFIVKNLIPSIGLCILAGPSKGGKSLLITQMLNAVSGGCNTFIGFDVVNNGDVLYLALEDSEQRLKERFQKQNIIPNEKFRIAFNWSFDEKAISDLDEYLSLHPEIILVVIDTKAKICKEQGTQISYQGEYNFMGLIKSCADKHGICIILVTHLRKRPSQEDVFNEINGTAAIMGAADTIMILKRPRNQNHGFFSLTSRDYQEREEEIYLDYTTLTWHSNGEINTAVPNMTPERQAIISTMENIGKPCKPREIAKLLGKDNKVIGNSLCTMKEYGFVKKSQQKSGYWLLPDWIETTYTEEDEYDEII